jgi:hypothetical protein
MPVLLRIENATGRSWDEVFVAAGSFRVFGPVKAGERSGYQPFEWAYRYGYLGARVGDGWLEMRPKDYMGEKKLGLGRYTWVIEESSGSLHSRLVNDESMPTPADLKTAFQSAEGKLSASRAAAFVHSRRHELADCRSAGDKRERVAMQWLVAPSGRVGGPRVMDESVKGTPLEKCLVDALKKLRFPRYSGAMAPAFAVDVPLGAGPR